MVGKAVQQPSRTENSKIEQLFSYFLGFDGDWRNVLFVRRSKSNVLVCTCSQVQAFALHQACVLPLETSLTPMRVARAIVPCGAK